MTVEQVGEVSQKAGLIFAKIAAVMADVEAISKDRSNTQQNFKFRGIDDLYNEIHPLLSKHKIFTVPTIVNRHYAEKVTKSGTSMYMRILTIRYRFYAEDGSYIDSIVDGEAMDSGDKSTSKCMAIAHKYCLLQVFCVPTEDEKDPDGKSPEGTLPKGKPQPQGGAKPKPQGKPNPEWQMSEQEFNSLKELAQKAGIKSMKPLVQLAGKALNQLTPEEYLKLCQKLAAQSQQQAAGASIPPAPEEPGTEDNFQNFR